MESVVLHDKRFELYLDPDTIRERIRAMAEQIARDLDVNDVLCVAVLNGAFVFAADLLRAFPEETQISFIKLSSYEGMHSTGNVRELIGLDEDIAGRHILFIEDIVDTGKTLKVLIDKLATENPASIRVATLLLKPNSFNDAFPIHYAGFEIPDDFVVGYGLDYNGLGRGLPGVYRVVY